MNKWMIWGCHYFWVDTQIQAMNVNFNCYVLDERVFYSQIPIEQAVLVNKRFEVYQDEDDDYL